MIPPPDDPPIHTRVPLAFVAASAMFVGAIAVRGTPGPLPHLPFVGVLALVLVAGLPHAVSPRRPWMLRAWVIAVMLSAGATLSNAARPADGSWATTHAEGPITRSGWVATTPRTDDGGGEALAAFVPREASQSFTLQLDGDQSIGDADRVTVRVSGLDQLPARGTRVTVRGWWRPSRGVANPGDRPRGPGGSIAVPHSRMVRVHDRQPAWHAPIAALRDGCNHAIARSMPAWADDDTRALVRAMTTGVRLPGLSRPASDFRAAGMSHVLAISGFNVAVLVGAAAAMLRAAHAGPVLNSVVAIAVAGAFLVVVEPDTSVWRAGCAAGLTAAAGMRGGRGRGLGTIGAVAVVGMCLDVDAVMDAGFQLSYGVVVGLLVLSPRIADRWQSRADRAIHAIWAMLPGAREPPEALRVATGILATAAAASVTAWVVSTPIAIAHAGTASGWAAPLSVATMPAAALTTIAGVAAAVTVDAVPPLGLALGQVAAACAATLDAIAVASLDLPGAVWWTGRPSPWWTIAALASGAAWIAAVDRRTRTVAMVVTLALGAALWCGPARPFAATVPRDSIEVITFEVGTGSCHLVRTARVSVLVDVGRPTDATVGARTAVPSLAALGVRRLDALVLTDRTMTRCSGVPEVLRSIPVGRILAPPALADALRGVRSGWAGALGRAVRASGVPVDTVVAGDRLQLGDVAIEVWHPRSGAEPSGRADGSLAVTTSRVTAQGDAPGFLAAGALGADHPARQRTHAIDDRSMRERAMESGRAIRAIATDGGGVSIWHWTDQGWVPQTTPRSRITESPTTLPSSGSSSTTTGASTSVARISCRSSPGRNRRRKTSVSPQRIRSSNDPEPRALTGRRALATRIEPGAAGG